MEIKALRSFLTIARERSLTGAARFLNVTQPTLSRLMKELETELGTKLFIRGSHNITLTDDGMLLRKRAEEIVDMVDKTTTTFTEREEEDGIGGEVYIGGGETYVMGHLAQLIEKLHALYPRIRYHLYSGNADDVTERLDKGLLDFGVLIQPAPLSKYDYLTLPAKDTWGIVMRKDHPLARKKGIAPRDLLGVPLIASRQAIRQSVSRNEFTEWFGDVFDRLSIIATINLIYNATLLVRQGVGCVFALEHLVYTGGESDLCFRPFRPKLQSDLNVVWKKFQIFSPAAHVFLKHLKTNFQSGYEDN